MQVGSAGYQPNQLTAQFSDREREQVNYNKARIIGGGSQVYDGIDNSISGSISTVDQSNISVNAGGKIDSSQNNLKDYSLIDSDSDAQMSIDLRVATKSGRQDIVNDLTNIGTGKFITDNLNVAKVNVDTIKNLVKPDITLERTYNRVTENFGNLQDAMQGKTSANDILRENINKTQQYNTLDGKFGEMAGFNNKKSDTIAINTNENINKTNGDYAETLAHENYHNKYGSNESDATSVGQFNRQFNDDYNGNLGLQRMI